MSKKESSELIEKVEEKIYVIRGQRVMTDSDLADIYGVETRTLNQAVNRNLARFPRDFVFRLSQEEFDSLISQTVTSKTGRGGRRKLPYVFTEHGAVMLASVLNSPTAVDASIVVVRAFVKMRSILALHKDLAKRIEQLSKVAVKHENDFNVVFHLLSEIMGDSKFLKRKIGFIEANKKGK
ncbi:MAG TPA: ORF6N domain-containing protein [Pyrinomonadaceae bacterium]|nr:ORF6N domain-containing protein [Pyrinomonadaceae bacterium]